METSNTLVIPVLMHPQDTIRFRHCATINALFRNGGGGLPTGRRGETGHWGSYDKGRVSHLTMASGVGKPQDTKV